MNPSNDSFSYELIHSVDVAKERLHDLLIYLAKDSNADITFNHLPCKVSEHLAGPVAIVQNHPNGFIIRLARDPKISSTYKGGLVMYDGNYANLPACLKIQLSNNYLGVSCTHMMRFKPLFVKPSQISTKASLFFRQPKTYPKPLKLSHICYPNCC